MSDQHDFEGSAFAYIGRLKTINIVSVEILYRRVWWNFDLELVSLSVDRILLQCQALYDHISHFSYASPIMAIIVICCHSTRNELRAFRVRQILHVG